MPVLAKPLMGRLVVNMHFIEECNEYIDVQERHQDPILLLIFPEGAHRRQSHGPFSLPWREERNAMAMAIGFAPGPLKSFTS